MPRTVLKLTDSGCATREQTGRQTTEGLDAEKPLGKSNQPTHMPARDVQATRYTTGPIEVVKARQRRRRQQTKSPKQLASLPFSKQKPNLTPEQRRGDQQLIQPFRSPAKGGPARGRPAKPVKTQTGHRGNKCALGL